MSNKILLSSDSLPWYGLDHIFQIAQDSWFDWLDLALWKNFDWRNTKYVKKLVDTYHFWIEVIQVSSDVNAKELWQAIDIAQALWVIRIMINPPKIFNMSSYRLISTVIPEIQKTHPHLIFSIINPKPSTLFILPIPKFRFSNLDDIWSKYHCSLGIDICHFDGDIMDSEFIKKIANYKDHIGAIYMWDKKWNQDYLPLDQWTLKIASFVKKIATVWIECPLSIKYQLDKNILADPDSIAILFQKGILFMKDHLVSW